MIRTQHPGDDDEPADCNQTYRKDSHHGEGRCRRIEDRRAVVTAGGRRRLSCEPDTIVGLSLW